MDKKAFYKLYDKIPSELQELLSSEEMGDDLENICTKYDILQYLAQINDYVGDTLLGLLPPNEFEETIKNDLKLDKDKAKKITREINRFVFYPVKSLLEDMYNMEIAPLAQMHVKPSIIIKEKSKKAVGGDSYREPIDLD